MEVGFSDNSGYAWRINDSATQGAAASTVIGNGIRVVGNARELGSAGKKPDENEPSSSIPGLKRSDQPSENDGNEDDSNAPIPLSSGSSVRDFLGASVPESVHPQDKDPRETEASAESTKGSDDTALTKEEQDQVEELKERDQEVRQHEQAHLAAAGSLANGGAQYEFQMGPDGKNYAIGGHVGIDTSPANTPQATISKARQIQRAALAPADPSPQDIKVAAQAMKMMMDAQRDLSEEEMKEASADETSEDVASITEAAVEISNAEAISQQASGKLEL